MEEWTCPVGISAGLCGDHAALVSLRDALLRRTPALLLGRQVTSCGDQQSFLDVGLFHGDQSAVRHTSLSRWTRACPFRLTAAPFLASAAPLAATVRGCIRGHWSGVGGGGR